VTTQERNWAGNYTYAAQRVHRPNRSNNCRSSCARATRCARSARDITDSVALHFTWKQDWPAVRALLPRLEAALEPFSARPHWGKLFTMQAAHVKSRSERLPDFRRLLEIHDPRGKFRNAFVDQYVFQQ
jgi:hypothetical protein